MINYQLSIINDQYVNIFQPYFNPCSTSKYLTSNIVSKQEHLLI